MQKSLASAGGMASLLLLTGASVPNEPPAPIVLDAAVESSLAKGEVHLVGEVTSTGGMTTGVIDIAAPPEATWDAVLDMDARARDMGSIRSVEVYLSQAAPERIGAEWTLSVFGTTVVFSVLYDTDRARGWCRFAMDKTRENDIVDTQGSYQTYAHGEGTRLVYRGFSDSGRYVPGWIKQWLSSNALEEQLQGIKRRAEGTAE